MNAKIFARNLQTVLEHKQMIKAELHRRSGISKGYITKILKGMHPNISDEYRKKFAKGLDIDLDMVDKLGDPETSDPIALISGQTQSVIVPFLFNFSDLIPKTVEAVLTLKPEDLKVFPAKKFISFPKCPPFSLMNTHRYIAVAINVDTGMAPKIEPGDVVTVNLDDTIPDEKKIYLIVIDGALKFRYAKLQTVRNRKYLQLWAEDRSLGEDIIDLQITKKHPILGNVRTHTRML